MNLTTYRAFSMAEALAAVKRDLGEDAAILHTRSYQKGGLLGLGKRTVVEVTAAPAREARAMQASTSSANARSRKSTGKNDRRAKINPLTAAAKAAYESNPVDPRSEALEELMQQRERMGTPSNQSPAASTAATFEEKRNNLLAAIEEQKAAREQSAKSTGKKSSGIRETERVLQEHEAKRATPVATVDIEVEQQSSRSSAVSVSAADIGRRGLSGEERVKKQRCLVIHHDDSNDVSRNLAPELLTDEVAVTNADSAIAPVAQRFVLQRAGRDESDEKDRISTETTNAEESPQPTIAATTESDKTNDNNNQSRTIPVAAHDNDDAREEMHAIKNMVSKILEQQQSGGGFGGGGGGVVGIGGVRPMPQQLFDMYLKLVGQELSDDLAENIVRKVERDLGATSLENTEVIRETVLRHLVELIPTADEPFASPPRDGRPLTIALIGPTGVGKTTTAAKLAATFKLRHNQRVGLVTSDTYRIAAVEQLRTYAEIIKLPLKVVLTPEEMKQACHQLRDCDVILIDTAGRSQKDRSKLGELNTFIEAANPHEVHLVLSSTHSERVLLQEAEVFGAIRADKIILTKLDEAVSFGMLVNVIRQVGKQLSFVTTGQEVPDHIEPGRAERLARLVLEGVLHSE